MNPPPTDWMLFWQDSEVAHVGATSEGALTITFSAASVQSRNRAPGYMHGVVLFCQAIPGQALASCSDWVGGIRHGQVLTPSGKQASMPLPGHIKGPLHLSFTLMNGTEISIDAKELTATPPDNPGWTESLAC